MDRITQNYCIITPPIGNAGISPLSNIVDVVSSLSNSVIVITGNKDFKSSKKPNPHIHFYKTQWLEKSNRLTKTLNHIHIQLDISYNLIKYANNANIWIYFLDSHAFILPVLIAQILRKKTIFLLGASISGTSKTNNNFLVKVANSQEDITLKLADYIIVYSPILIEKWNLQNYKHKILIAHEHVINLDKFRVKNNLTDRQNTIGYIGRLSSEKGVEKFVQSLPIIFGNQKSNYQVMIGGDGLLRSKIENSIHEQGLLNRVEMTGWISHDRLPDYLNRLRLLVLPSNSEGLPNIILEAMACGTPVLVTPVGAIPDYIKDGETGFIMENNSPECIADNINRALKDFNLVNIAMNAKKMVETQFTFESTVKLWRIILNEISAKKGEHHS
jgi:glycosyltransferase involved in cell wall biosynthesis